MNILIITMSLPYPPASGGAIRVHGIVEGLEDAGHDVTLMCFHTGDIDHEAVERINLEIIPPPHRTRLDRLRDLLLSHQPDIARRFYDATFIDRLRELLEDNQYDLVQFEGIESVCYLPIVQQAQPRARLIFDTFNAEYALQQNIYRIDRRNPRRWLAALYSWIQVGRIKRFERQMCRMADAVIAVSQEDARLLQQFRQDRRIHVIPNGIWVDRYSASDTIPHDKTLVFTGKMDYRPNVDAMLWFTEAIWPHIKAAVPEVKLYIVGQQPHARLDHLREQPNIIITGWVDSVLPYLQLASVYIAPLRMGSGTRLKLLEAMASGCAIVATTTASAGLRAEMQAAMRIADDPTTIAQAILELLSDPEQRQQLRTTAFQNVRQYYDWSVLIPRLLNVYKDIDLG